jgi:hypothetical protein
MEFFFPSGYMASFLLALPTKASILCLDSL